MWKGQRKMTDQIYNLCVKIILFLAIYAFLNYCFPTKAEENAQGHELFKQNCVVCHGEKGEGDGPAAPGLYPRPRNLVKGSFIMGDSVEAIANTINNGFNQMPSFSNLTDDERHAIARYVKALRK